MGKFASTLAVGLLIWLSGCSTGLLQPEIQTQIVKVPVSIPCQVTIPTHTPLPIAKLRPNSSPADTIRAYAASVYLLEQELKADESLLEVCLNHADAQVH